jgi:uncharacterized Fe-S cluster protein YjdI
MTKKLYTNGEIEVSWEPDLCIHSAECVKGSIKAFDPRRRPWIELQHETTGRLLEIVERCPSAALKARRLATGEVGRNEEGDDPRVGGEVGTEGRRGAEAQEGPKPVITASKNGPLEIRFHCEIRDAEGNLIRTVEKASLCRCGQSANKPFCDGTHRKAGFTG